jgi:anhydro-N-acetylmuramic acid kinase
MSGTSADGMDVALVAVASAREEDFSARLLAYQEIPFSSPLQSHIHALARPGGHQAGGGLDALDQMLALDLALGYEFARAARDVLRSEGVSPTTIRAIGHHGQTIRHRPSETFGGPGASLQIGSGAVLVEELGIPVVCDFRSRDMALGGQGAPLVPLLDQLLLTQEVPVVTLNLGGIANLTWLPPRGSPERVLAYDTGPANAWLDAACRWGKIPGGMDAGGARARRGELDGAWLAELLSHDYFRRPAPKSTGLEEFGAQVLLPQLEGRDLDSILRTLVEVTARSVGDALEQVRSLRGRFPRLYVSGGGRRNDFLLERLQDLTPGVEWRDPVERGVPADAKEAFAFAVLAARYMEDLPGNLPEVTGARRKTRLGSLLTPLGSVLSEG